MWPMVPALARSKLKIPAADVGTARSINAIRKLAELAAAIKAL